MFIERVTPAQYRRLPSGAMKIQQGDCRGAGGMEGIHGIVLAPEFRH